jgi:hypothetical protein
MENETSEDIRKRNRDNFMKFYLGRFAIPLIDKKLFDKFSNYNSHMNLVITVDFDVDVIRSIVATLLVKDREFLKWEEIGLIDLLRRNFSAGSRDLNRDFDLDEDDETNHNVFFYPEVLFITELDDQRNKLYQEIVSNIVSRRMLEDKSTILILTTRSPKELITPGVLKNFSVINLRGIKFFSTSKTFTNTQEGSPENSPDSPPDFSEGGLTGYFQKSKNIDGRKY